MRKKVQVIEIPPFHELAQLWDEMLEEEERMKATTGRSQAAVERITTGQAETPFRTAELPRASNGSLPTHLRLLRVWHPGVLDVAHLDCDPRNCDLTTLPALSNLPPNARH